MALHYQHDELSFDSIKSDILGYSWDKLRHDLSAGFSVALITIPTAMAYALVAGLPLVCGLYASIYASIIAAFFGSCRHLVVGPTNALALLVQLATSEIIFTYYRMATDAEKEVLALQILTQLVLLVGLFQLAAAAFKLGRLTQFVSHSVVVGYITGVALAIVITQSQTFFGLPPMQGVYSLYQRATYIITHLNAIHLPTLLIGLGSLIGLIVIKRYFKRLPAGVIVLAGAALAVHLFGFSSYTEPQGSFSPYDDEALNTVALVGDAGEIRRVLPIFSFPYFDTGIMNHLIPYAFAIALLSILETSSVAKAIATNSGQRLSINQEILGLGLGNLFSSFIGALPASGNTSRSTLMYCSGGQTRFASIFNAVIAFMIVGMFGFFVSRIPLAGLSAILLFNVVNIINAKQFFLCLKATSSDAFVLIVTFLSCMFFSLHIAFYIGVALSISLYLKKASMPHLMECTFDDTGKLGNIDFSEKREKTKIRMINVHGELFFGAADLFQSTLKTLAEDDNETKVIILRLKNARDIDATACLALQQLYEYLKGSGRYLIACGLTEQSWQVMCDSGLVELLGKENLFTFDERSPHHTVQKALIRAKALLNESETISISEKQIPFPYGEPTLETVRDTKK